jgi:hypothetical protein
MESKPISGTRTFTMGMGIFTSCAADERDLMLREDLVLQELRAVDSTEARAVVSDRILACERVVSGPSSKSAVLPVRLVRLLPSLLLRFVLLPVLRLRLVLQLSNFWASRSIHASRSPRKRSSSFSKSVSSIRIAACSLSTCSLLQMHLSVVLAM